MPSDYELGAGRSDGEGIPLAEFTLADGTVSLILPTAWSPQDEEFRAAQLDIPDLAGASLSIELKVAEDPAAVAANALENYLNRPGFPPLDDAGGAPDFETLTVRARGTSSRRGDPGASGGVRIWRKLGLLRPGLIRVLEVQLEVPVAAIGSEPAQELEDMVDHLLKFVRFADHETAADRVAPAAGLRSVALWDTVYLRLPEGARVKRENADGTGMYVADDPVEDRWTLWVNFDVYRTDGPVDVEAMVAGMVNDMEQRRQPRDLVGTAFDPMSDRPDEALATIIFRSVENGETLRHTAWHKVVRRGKDVIFGYFTWVVVEAQRDEPDLRALTDLMAREVRNAVLFHGGGHEREAPGGEPP